MQYMLLIYGDENAWEGMSPEEQAAGLEPWTDYTKWLKETGAYVAGASHGSQASSSWPRMSMRLAVK